MNEAMLILDAISYSLENDRVSLFLENREDSTKVGLSDIRAKILGRKGDLIFLQVLFNYVSLDGKIYSNEDLLVPVIYYESDDNFEIITSKIKKLGFNDT